MLCLGKGSVNKFYLEPKRNAKKANNETITSRLKKKKKTQLIS